jgi:glutaredoxin 3
MYILLVDDDSFFRSAIKRMLQKEGFEIIEAGNGTEGYEAVKEFGATIGLLLTDFSMPGMDGLELAQFTTKLHPNMPVLLMTGNAFNLPKARTRYIVLHKPIRRHTLVEAIREAVGDAVRRQSQDVSEKCQPEPEIQKQRVEIFSAGCCCCEDMIAGIRAAACPSCEITVLDIKQLDVAQRAKQLGVRFVPAVVINGELVEHSKSGTDLVALLVSDLGAPLS